MKNYKRLKKELNVDMEAECFYQYVYGKDDIFNPHCHDFFEIFLTISNNVSHFINGKITNLHEGTLVFIRPDDVHGYIYENPENKKNEYINLTFTRKTAEDLFTYLSDGFPTKELLNAKMPPSVILNRTEKKRLLHEISELNTVNWQNKNALKIKMRALLANIFVRYFSEIPKEDFEKMPLWFSLLIKDMEKPENFIAGTKRMIELSGKSREHLSRNIKKLLNTSLSNFINELRINYAANLLLYTNASVLDICYNSGFATTSQFYKLFKEKYGVSPREFRKL